VAHYQLGLAFDSTGQHRPGGSGMARCVRRTSDIVEVYRALAALRIHRGDPGELGEGMRIRFHRPAAERIMTDPCAAVAESIASSMQRRTSILGRWKKGAQYNPPPRAAGPICVRADKVAEAQKAYQQGLIRIRIPRGALGGVLN